jgi:hypothetical protein
MKPLFNAFLLPGLFMCCIQQGYGQKADTLHLISVSLRIIGKGTPQYPKDASPGYFALATLTNNQDTAIHFWIMTCSWYAHNWLSSNDSIHFFGSPVCDRNIPDRINLIPHQSMDFYGLLEPRNNKPLPKTVKLGFIYFASFNDIYDFLHGRNNPENLKIYWGNQARIRDNLYSYHMN